MLTRTAHVALTAAFALLTAGLGAGNFFYATLALVPLGVFAVGATLEPPARLTATLETARRNPRAGDKVPVTVRYRVERGTGPFEIHVALPDVVELAEGSNLALVTKKEPGPVEGEFTFTVRYPKRGVFRLGPVTAERIHPALVRSSRTEEVVPAEQVDVRPALAPVRRIRGLSGFAKQLFPENDQSKTGIRTTEFREIRTWASGDPTKYINWKATARLPGFASGTQAPLVNEYEREGKKNVWIFLDAAPYMQFGTTVENSFEYALQGANGVAEFYIRRGYKIGFVVFNHPQAGFLHPDTGKRQRIEIQRVLTNLAPGKDDVQGLFGAVEQVHRHLLTDKPLVVVITRLGKADERTFQALRKLRALTGRRRRRIPVLLISPVVHGALERTTEYDADVVRLLRRYDRPQLARARRLGARVVEWDPRESKLESLLMRGGGNA